MTKKILMNDDLGAEDAEGGFLDAEDDEGYARQAAPRL